MSISEQKSITCPKCSKTGSFKIWRSINTSLDPEMRQAVRDGSAFIFSCPHCNNKTHVEYGFLYHQMDDQIMIDVATSEEDAKQALEAFSGGPMADIMRDFKMETHYLNRIVKSQNGLREKLNILDNGYDDRLMEIYKVFLLSEYQKMNPNAKEIELLYYENPEGTKGVQVFCDGQPDGSFRFSEDMYKQLYDIFMPKLKDIRDEQPFVNREWALNFIRSDRAKNQK